MVNKMVIALLGCLIGFGASASADDETIAKDAFVKTLASGTKNIELSNINVELVKSSPKHPDADVSWKANCTTSALMTLNGDYPKVNASFGKFDCGSKYNAPELSYLSMITRTLEYSLHHIPAYPTEPNQFRLQLETMSTPYLQWKSIESLNSLTKDHVVSMDFMGMQKGNPDWKQDANHFVQISYVQSDDGKHETLYIEYRFDKVQRDEHTIIKIKADLDRVN